MLSMYQIIDKKKRGQELSGQEIKWVINGMLDKTIADYQLSALLMAIYLQGMNADETASLTDAMLYSGKVLTMDDVTVVDKHSTGGIGDKASFILAPIAAAAGVKVPMIAGRGLGFTGGTIDKVESVAGFNTQIPLDEFTRILKERGLVLIGQTEEIAPADKILYALRDVTATIESIPLITASIMSKKLAAGVNGIVMDIKVGSGAFMHNLDEAREMAKSILRTAKRFKRNAAALITNMDEPLGEYIGNSLEILESIQTLRGEGPSDLTELSIELAAHMIHLANICPDLNSSREKALEVLHNGEALKRFEKLIVDQGGDANIITKPELLPLASERYEIKAQHKGKLISFQNDQLGYFCTDLGGGRKRKEDSIDPSVGLRVHKKIGDKVDLGETLITVYHHKNQIELIKQWETKILSEVITIKEKSQNKAKLILDVLTLKDVE